MSKDVINKSLVNFDKYSNDKNYNKLEVKINKLLELYDKTSNDDDKELILNNIKDLKNKLEIKELNSDVNNISYPDYEDKKFIEKLIKKKEFAITKMNEEDIKIMKKDFFELTKNQKFLKRLISPETPYRSIYLYHSVGVGKTCASIQISHNFKKYYNKRALILLPSKLKDNYINGLFDIRKLDDDNMEQCLGNYYLHNIVNRNKLENNEIKLKAEKMITQEYEILSFGQFNNTYKRIKKNSRPNEYFKNIREYFDDRVIIVDEIHNMRVTNEDTKDKEVTKTFLEMLEIIKNNVLVLLSATPMFDNYNELNLILNALLLQNGEKKILRQEKIFEDGILNKEYEKKLKKISSNFISYMRGENPFSFPIRLYPSINNDENILDKKDYPKKDIYGEKISKDMQIKNLELIKTVMSTLQDKIYNKIDTNKTNEDDEESVNIQQRVQISNIIYSDDKEITDTYGNNGLKKVFKIEEKKSGEYKLEYRNLDNQILKYNKVKSYSPKIKLLLENIGKSQGVVLVYSRYLASGVIPIAAALEQFGYNKYDNRNILKNGDKQGNKGKYVIISGNRFLSPNNTKEIQACTNKNNIEGEKIKVILITESGTEGIDLKYIREIHIFDPWYNLNRLEQIIGRGIRNFSHIDLPSAQRNTTIYQYVNLTKKNKTESIDFRTYRIAENKQKKIAQLEKIIKNNAIDCNLNIEGNRFINLNPIRILTSRGRLIEKYNINDKNGSRVCNYDKCEMKCDKEVKINNIDDNTYKREFIDYDINIIIKYLRKFLKEKSEMTIEDIYDKIDIKNKEILYFALNKLVTKKIKFRGINNREGYLIYRKNYYIFQPIDIKDEKILKKERDMKKISRSKKIILDKLSKNKKDEEINDSKFNKDYIENNLEKLRNLVMFTEKEFNEEEKIFYDILVDGLNEQDFEVMVRNVLNKKLDEEIIKKLKSSLKRGYYMLDDDNIIYSPFKNKFVCKNGKKIEDCNPIQETQNKKKLKDKLKIYKNANILDYGYLELIDGIQEFKLKDLEKLKNKKQVTGTKCVGTSTINVDKLLGFIKEINKDVIKSQDVLSEKFQKKKYNKPNLCVLYQYVLRKETKEDKIYFARPILRLYKNNKI
jgi:hypothetical protein